MLISPDHDIHIITCKRCGVSMKLTRHSETVKFFDDLSAGIKFFEGCTNSEECINWMDSDFFDSIPGERPEAWLSYTHTSTVFRLLGMEYTVFGVAGGAKFLERVKTAIAETPTGKVAEDHFSGKNPVSDPRLSGLLNYRDTMECLLKVGEWAAEHDREVVWGSDSTLWPF